MVDGFHDQADGPGEKGEHLEVGMGMCRFPRLFRNKTGRAGNIQIDASLQYR